MCCLVSKCLEISLLPFCYQLLVCFFVVGEHTCYVISILLNLLMFVLWLKIKINLDICSVSPWKSHILCCCHVWYFINVNLNMLKCWLMVLLSCFILLLTFGLVVLSSIERDFEFSNCNCGFFCFSFHFYQLLLHIIFDFVVWCIPI